MYTHSAASHVANYSSNIQLEATSVNDVKSEENLVSKCVVNPFDINGVSKLLHASYF